jgi:hypothetical protein
MKQEKFAIGAPALHNHETKPPITEFFIYPSFPVDFML